MIGNPPFLGGKLLNTHLGEDYVSRLFAAWEGRAPAEADLVCYWFVKAGEQVEAGRARRVGLVATNSIRGGANRRALEAATRNHPIFEAWSDEPWIIDRAAVRVSLVCFAGGEEEAGTERRLDGRPVGEVHADLTARRGDAGVDLTGARRLYANVGVAFMGDTKGGPFDVRGEQVRDWLTEPANPNGRPNSDVLRPWRNGMDVVRRPADKWIVDFGGDMVREEAALYEAPYRHASERVHPMRLRNRRESYRERRWRHMEPRPGMRRALEGLSRYIATPRVAKHRLFVWMDARICPGSQLIVIARDDDTTFGILHSRFHEAWSLRLGTSLEDRPRYTPTTTFETFPFPEGLAPLVPAGEYATDPRAAAIAEAARQLVALRDRWLNPPCSVSPPAPGTVSFRLARGQREGAALLPGSGVTPETHRVSDSAEPGGGAELIPQMKRPCPTPARAGAGPRFAPRSRPCMMSSSGRRFPNEPGGVPMRQLDLNREAYNKVKDDLESRYPNGVALMHDGKVVEIYGDTEAAFGIGCERYGEGNFSTKKIGQRPASLGAAASHARPVRIT